MNRAAAVLNRLAVGGVGLGLLGWGAQECLWTGEDAPGMWQLAHGA